LTKKRLT